MQHFLMSVVRPLRTRLFPFLLLPFVCTACMFGWGDTPSPSSTAQPEKQALMPTPSEIRLGAQPCPRTLKDPASWKTTVALDADQSVEHVYCGYLLGIPTLQAVVTVRHAGPTGMLDTFVYTAITSTHPQAVFSAQGLMHGDAKISGYNTLLTAQEDPDSAYNTAQVGQWTVDLYHEYKWSDTAKSLVQIEFSGIFPDLTRYQAEIQQIAVNNGRDYQQWRVSAVSTAQHFAQNLLKWPFDTPATVISGGGLHDIRASVQIKQPTSSLIVVQLDRLELNADGGIWEVTGVQSPGLALTLNTDQPLASPMTVNGQAIATTRTYGTVEILDHVYKESGKSEAWGPASPTGQMTFSKPVPYTVSFKGGTQEGLVMLSASNGSDHMLTGVALAKVLLSA